MKKCRIFILLALALIFAFTFVACSSGGGSTPNEDDDPSDSTDGGSPGDASPTTWTVQVTANEQSAVEFSEGNRRTVKEGESAVFKVNIKDGYEFSSVTHGSYDAVEQTLTVPDVSSNMMVQFKVNKLDYDPAATVRFKFNITALDSTSAGSGWQDVNYGTKVTLIAGDTSRYFKGWTIGGTFDSGADVLSTEREFVLDSVPSVIGNDTVVQIYANYVDTNIVKYDLNGGSVNEDSTNMKGNDYYAAEYADGVVTVTLSDAYLDFAESASTFWDDGSFYRDGYVLAEYNTKADGTGDAYSLGSKFYAPSTPDQTLYCIWMQATAASDFEYEDVQWGYASGVTEITAPHWKIDGVKITKYNGDAKTVVIPEKIGDKYVTTIDTDAFVNKGVETLVISKYIIRINDGAFKGCSSLKTVYMSDGIFYMNDAALDEASYTSLTNFYLNATMAPRFTKNAHGDGAVFSVKLSRILASQDKNRVIVVSGSSTYQGLSSAYLEALFDGEYTVINMGTTRTGTGMIFFEAMQNYTHEGDIVIYAPENHVNMFGQNEMWYRSFYDLEGMYNLFRYIDISHYPKVFSALSAYNKEKRFSAQPRAYEDIAGSGIRSDKYGDFQQPDESKRGSYLIETNYIDSYFITLNKYYKNDLLWNDIEYQTSKKDYTDPENTTWTDFTVYKDEVNRAIRLVQETGAKVYFGFAPTDGDDIVPEAQNAAWLEAYDKLIEDNYEFDGLVGSCKNYIFAHKYFFDCAYHVNDYGRTYRTYQLYVDLCEILGIEDVNGIYDVGTDFAGCLFEEGSDGTPVTKVDYLQ